MASTQMQDLKDALCGYGEADRYHQATRFNRVPFTCLKHLAQAVESTAAVHRNTLGKYDCWIDGKPLRMDGTHTTPNQAWACLAKHLITREPAMTGVNSDMECDGGAA